MDILEWIIESAITTIVTVGEFREKPPTGWDVGRFVSWGQDFEGLAKKERMELLKWFLRHH